MKTDKKIPPHSEFDWQDILHYMSLTPKQKLEYLEKMNRFLLKITPKSAKEANERLKSNGF